MTLTIEEAQRRADELRNRERQTDGASGAVGGSGVGAAPPTARYRHVKPFHTAVDGFVTEAQDNKRIYTGIEPLDRAIRGIGRGHFAEIIGASHAGKGLVVTEILRTNRDRPVLAFIPDETDVQILAKLASRETGVDAETLEAEVAARNSDYIDLLRDVATNQYPNLIVLDKPIDPNGMEEAWVEACDVFGSEPELVLFDYVQLLRDLETVEAKFDFLKSYGKRHNVPFIALHQTSRTAGREGQGIDIDSGTYGGEAHAFYMIGVRRKQKALYAELRELRNKIERKGMTAADEERLAQLEFEMDKHKYTVTLNLVKNKRLGGGLVDEFDMEIVQGSGALVLLEDGEWPRQYQTEMYLRSQARYETEELTHE